MVFLWNNQLGSDTKSRSQMSFVAFHSLVDGNVSIGRSTPNFIDWRKSVVQVFSSPFPSLRFRFVPRAKTKTRTKSSVGERFPFLEFVQWTPFGNCPISVCKHGRRGSRVSSPRWKGRRTERANRRASITRWIVWSKVSFPIENALESVLLRLSERLVDGTMSKRSIRTLLPFQLARREDREELSVPSAEDLLDSIQTKLTTKKETGVEVSNIFRLFDSTRLDSIRFDLFVSGREERAHWPHSRLRRPRLRREGRWCSLLPLRFAQSEFSFPFFRCRKSWRKRCRICSSFVNRKHVDDFVPSSTPRSFNWPNG